MASMVAPRPIKQVRNKIELDETPQTFALKQPANGKEVGQFGSVMYSASDGRVLFVVAEDASDFHHQLVDLGIQPGEAIRVSRVRHGRGGGFAIRVARVSDAEEGPPEPKGGTGAHANSPHPYSSNITSPNDSRIPAAPEIAPASARLCAALKAAIDATVEASIYAKRVGMKLEFNEEDVRCLAITCYIQSAKGGC